MSSGLFRTLILAAHLALIPYLIATYRSVDDLHGVVVKVPDGETLALFVNRESITIALAEIDAPEEGQPYALAARESLTELALAKSATCTEQRRDFYGRTVARCVVEGVDVSVEQVRRGFAWVRERYGRGDSLRGVEKEARLARRGLWGDENATPPWAWRRL